MAEGRATVLSRAQQAQLDAKKVELAAADERYLRSHPEIQKMMGAFVDHVLATRPAAVRLAAVDFFEDPTRVRDAIRG